jgi:PGF-CTERM protein
VTPVLAAEAPRERPGGTSPPVTVYVSETLDISDVRLTGGGRVQDDDRPAPVTFQRVDGPESVTVEDPEAANFSGVTPGSYDALEDDDERAELEVVQPRVTRLTLRTRGGTVVTNGSVRADRIDALGVVAEYDFEEADRLQVTMTRDGEDVGLDRRAARITESGGRYVIGFGDRGPGAYTVTVTGSGIEAGTRSATVRVVDPDATATPSPTPTPTATETRPITPTPSPTPTAPATTAPVPTTTVAVTATQTTAAPTPTDGEGPGPGVVGALVALFAAAGLAARRRP